MESLSLSLPPSLFLYSNLCVCLFVCVRDGWSWEVRGGDGSVCVSINMTGESLSLS